MPRPRFSMPQVFPQAAAPQLSSPSDTRLLIGLFVALFLVNLLFPRDLWVQDEARYGEIVREMLAGGPWLVPHLNAHPYPDKPALYFYLVIALGWLVGHGELAFRLLSALATGLTAAGVFTLGRVLFDRQTGFWAALLFLSVFLTLLVGQIARMDMLLAASAVYAWLALARAYAGGGARWLAAFWALTALSIAVKGPIALLFTLLPGLAWRLWEEGWQACKRWHWLGGVLALLGLAGAWIGMVSALGHQAYLETIWHEQLVGRAINSWSQKQPVYFYLLLLPLLLMPWSGLVVQGGLRLWRERPPAWRGVAAFSLVPLAGLSLISGKLFIYLQPLLPGLCLAGGLAAVRLAQSARVSAWNSVPPLLFLLLLGGALGWGAAHYLDLPPWQFGVGGGLLIALLATGARAARRTGRRWLWAWTGISMVLSWAVFGALLSLVNPLYSARDLGRAVARLAAPDKPVAVSNSTRGILNYYAGRTMEEVPVEQAAAWLADHPDGVLVLKRDDLPGVFGAAPPACRADETYRVELKDYHVLAGC